MVKFFRMVRFAEMEAKTLLFGITKDDRVYFTDAVSKEWLPEMIFDAKYIGEHGTKIKLK